jgi:hypothetical protein
LFDRDDFLLEATKMMTTSGVQQEDYSSDVEVAPAGFMMRELDYAPLLVGTAH